jgi:hypothetical protein
MRKAHLTFAMLILAPLFVVGDLTSADAQQRYRREQTSCPPGTVPVPETDNCIPRRRGDDDRRVDDRYRPRDERRPNWRDDYRDERRRDDYGRDGRREVSTLCSFRRGPRAGTTVDYAAYGKAPIPVGGPCNDGVASEGVVVGRGRYR